MPYWKSSVRFCGWHFGHLAVAIAKPSLVSGSPCFWPIEHSSHIQFVSAGVAGSRCWCTSIGQGILLTIWLFHASSMVVLNPTWWKSLDELYLIQFYVVPFSDLALSEFNSIICFLTYYWYFLLRSCNLFRLWSFSCFSQASGFSVGVLWLKPGYWFEEWWGIGLRSDGNRSWTGVYVRACFH